MARRATQTSDLTKGVLDPDLSERIDLKHYYSSLADGVNMEVRPQGGVSRRAGWAVNSDADVASLGYKRRIRRRITPLPLSASNVTVFNGGTAANLFDQDAQTLFSTSAVASSYFVMAEIDLGEPMEIAFVDVQGFYCGTTAKDGALAVEYFNNVTWVEVSGPIDTGAATRFNIRTRQSALPVTIDLASTTSFALTGYPVVDDVQTAAGMKVLVKDHDDASKNGLYDVPTPSGDWVRATTADTAAEVLQAAYYVSNGTINGGTTWVNLQTSLSELNDFGTTSPVTYGLAPAAGRTRRFGAWPGGPRGVPIVARHWRIAVKNGTGAGAISIAGLRFWQERRELSPSRVFAFDRSLAAMYDLVLTDRNIDVFKASPTGSRRFCASIPVPIAAHQIDEVTAIQSRDTMVFFHEDVPTVRVVRQGSDTEWNADVFPAYNVPAIPPGTAFAGSQDEIQDVTLSGIANGDEFVIGLGDLISAPITYAGTATIGALIAAAIDALPGLAAPTVSLIDPTPRLRIAFTGSNGSRAWPAVQIMPLGDSAAEPLHEITQPGFAANGAYFGAKTGWPRCGFFVQSRVLLAGFRAAPSSWGVSAIESFDFNPFGSPLTADMGFFRTLETDQLETIQQIFVGRHLQFFTDSSEWYIESRTLDATQPANAVRATGQGIKSSVRAVFAEGSTIVVQQGGRTVRDFLFDNVEQSYKAEPLSLLGPHLLTDVIDVAQRKAKTTSEANLIFFLNASGDMATLSLLRSQEVIAMMPHRTDGAWRSVTGHINGDVVALVERETEAGGADILLEVRAPGVLLDSALIAKPEPPYTTITGLDHLEGKVVWAYAGAQLCGPFTVADGTIEIDAEDAASEVTVGLFPELYGKLQTLREMLQNAQPFRPPGRIYEVGLSLRDTGQIEIRANGAAWRDVPLMFMDGGTLNAGQLQSAGLTPDKPLLQRLVTGEVTVENLRGWSEHPQLEFRQSVPAPLHIKAIRCEVAGKG